MQETATILFRRSLCPGDIGAALRRAAWDRRAVLFRGRPAARRDGATALPQARFESRGEAVPRNEAARLWRRRRDAGWRFGGSVLGG